jgi:hypothetical protein
MFTWKKSVSVKTQPSDICNNIILHVKGYMFRLYPSHLQALKGQIHNIIINNALWDPQRFFHVLYKHFGMENINLKLMFTLQ